MPRHFGSFADTLVLLLLVCILLSDILNDICTSLCQYNYKHPMYYVTRYCKHTHVVGPYIANTKCNETRSMLMDSYCPRTVRCAPTSTRHTHGGRSGCQVSFRLRRRYAGSRDSWRPLMYWRQWRIVPPSLVTVQDVWSVVSMRVHNYAVSCIS